MTAHKCKGLEFDIVALHYDIFPTEDKLAKLEITKQEWIKYNPQEINLMYVAATRAKFRLSLPETYYEFFNQ
jgi:ATP-dependent exoDNAse (exonuclease V) beta subunit